ncbi:MAG: hypothetical protein J7539_07110 [Niabella sp.]|nr:hypothetical protein [Niabella sp.]
MKKYLLYVIAIMAIASACNIACRKQAGSTAQQPAPQQAISSAPQAAIGHAADLYNFDVTLLGMNQSKGTIRFRQDPATPKVITLYTKILNLLPDHEYQLQRAVDKINEVDGICSSNTWLTLGLGLTPHSIITDDEGNGHELLWRSVSAIPSGSSFDIHFQVIDAVSHEVVLTSDCYQYTVL